MLTAETKSSILASFRRAILGMKIPSIRGIGISLNHNKTLNVVCYLDRQPTERDYEDLSDIVGEVVADMDIKKVKESCIYSNDKLGDDIIHDAWVYLRK